MHTMRSTTVAVLFGFLVSLAWVQTQHTPVVELKSGKLQGLVQEITGIHGLEGHKVHFYEGIRYGEAKRFSAPTAAPSWTGVYNATVPRFACPQEKIAPSDHHSTHEGGNTNASSEDCLFVNVWTPADSKTTNRTVMVYIHGGSYHAGTIFQGHHLNIMAALGDIVTVTVNYRLNAFGFLYGGTADAPGNLGIRDQILALQWVRDNIHHFGGNPADVTVFGESAGAHSVGILALSPMAKGLFHRAILQSGGASAHRAAYDKTRLLNSMAEFAERLSCWSPTNAAMLACLRTKTTTEIWAAHSPDFIAGYGSGDEVLPMRPVEALKAGHFHDVDLMFGTVSSEGVSFIGGVFTAEHDKTLTLDGLKHLLSSHFHHYPYHQEVVERYTQHLTAASTVNDLKRAFGQAYGDWYIACHPIFQGEQMAASNPTKRHYYSYVFTHYPSGGCHSQHAWMDVCHAEDVAFVFGNRIHNTPSADSQLSTDMLHAWVQFAKTGNPGKMGTVQWTDAFATGHTANVMRLDPHNYTMVPGYYKPTCDDFWKPKIFV